VEALACGTPVVTFRSGGSPECIDETCGISVETGDTDGLLKAIHYVRENRPFSPEACRKRAEAFDAKDRFREYIRLYEEVTSQ
jgi:glycosyltransferase involved in cell wall biosynthesis